MKGTAVVLQFPNPVLDHLILHVSLSDSVQYFQIVVAVLVNASDIFLLVQALARTELLDL